MASVLRPAVEKHLSTMDTKSMTCIRLPPRIDGAVTGKGREPPTAPVSPRNAARRRTFARRRRQQPSSASTPASASHPCAETQAREEDFPVTHDTFAETKRSRSWPSMEMVEVSSWSNVTAHPTEEWTKQQLREAFPWASAPRYLHRARDKLYTEGVRATLTPSASLVAHPGRRPFRTQSGSTTLGGSPTHRRLRSNLSNSLSHPR